jgi:hypothetical protein
VVAHVLKHCHVRNRHRLAVELVPQEIQVVLVAVDQVQYCGVELHEVARHLGADRVGRPRDRDSGPWQFPRSSSRFSSTWGRPGRSPCVTSRISLCPRVRISSRSCAIRNGSLVPAQTPPLPPAHRSAQYGAPVKTRPCDAGPLPCLKGPAALVARGASHRAMPASPGPPHRRGTRWPTRGPPCCDSTLTRPSNGSLRAQGRAPGRCQERLNIRTSATVARAANPRRA